VNSEEVFYIGADPGDPRRLLWLPLSQLRRHCLVTGSTGTGKSMLLVDMILQRVVAGESCIVIDPKGDLVRDVLACIALMPKEDWPALARDLVLIDPTDTVVPAAFNPLEITPYGSPSRQRGDVLSTFRRVFEFDDSRVTRLVLVLRKSVQLAIEHNLTIVDLPRLLTDNDFRDALVRQSSDDDLRRFWELEFPNGNKANQQQWTASTLVRLETLLDDPTVKRFFGRAHSTFDFRDIMDTGKVCLISLSKGAIGDASRLLGGFLMSRVQLAAESRAMSPAGMRHPCTVFVDEFQNYATTSFGEMLAEARGYGVSLVMAHQHLGQLPDDLRHAALSNSALRLAFRLGADDSAAIAREYWRVAGQRVKQEWWNIASLGPIPIPYKQYKFFSVSEEARQNRDLIQHLPDRHMLLHVAGEDQPYLLKTVDVPLHMIAGAASRVEQLKRVMADMRAIDVPREPGALAKAATTPIAPASRTFEWRRAAGGRH